MTDEWYKPSHMHGTAVTGIIGARRGNGVGVVGVLNNENVCYVTASVFGDDAESGARQSDVLSAVAWVADQGERGKTNFGATDMLELPAGNSEIFELTTCLFFCPPPHRFLLDSRRRRDQPEPRRSVSFDDGPAPVRGDPGQELARLRRLRQRRHDGPLLPGLVRRGECLPDVVRFRNAHSGPMMYTVRSS